MFSPLTCLPRAFGFLSLTVCFLLSAFNPPGRAALTSEIVYSFNAPVSSPLGELVQGKDGSFYGTSSAGGAGGVGTVFKLGADGSIQTLVEFTGTGGANRGANPAGGLVFAGDGNLYGTTIRGGSNNLGTVFKITPDGVLTTLADFGDLNSGAFPYAAMVLAQDGNLYGTTSQGGGSGVGTIYEVFTTDGSVSTLVEFTGKTDFAKGANPYAAMVQGTDGRLFGTTASGGAPGSGTIFAYSPADSSFTTLVEFTGNGPTNKGSDPYGALVLGNDGNFYGTTARGGAHDLGTVFQMTPDTYALTTLAQFTGNSGTTRGSLPEAGLVVGGDGNLYGTTYSGGINGVGTFFGITLGGTLSTYFDFSGTSAGHKGSAPESALTLGQDGNLYGTTFRGGASDAGTLFRINTDCSFNTLVEFSAATATNCFHSDITVATDKNVYGTTAADGVHGKGTIYKISFDGTLSTLVEFTGTSGASLGATPRGALLVSATDGNLYGSTEQGGSNDLGTLFKLTPDGVFTTLVEFTGTGGANKGANPRSALIEGTDGFYGVTAAGGASGNGTIFKVTPDGTLTTLVEFTGTSGTNKGSAPHAALVKGPNGNFYGTTSRGGTKDLGTVFMATPEGALTTLVEFADDPTTVAGAYPEAALLLASDGNFYGTTASGGATGDGTVFRMTPQGSLTRLFEFTDHRSTNKGSFPLGGLLQASDGFIYGTTAFGGTREEGTAFRFLPGNPQSVLSTLTEFAYTGLNSDAAYPESGFQVGTDGNIYATTCGGGSHGVGTVFRLRLRPLTLQEEAVNLQSDSARLRARFRTGGLNSTVAFRYEVDGGTWITTAAQSIGSGPADAFVSADLTGLLPNTTYHYQTVTVDSSGTVFGPDQTFTTEPFSTEVISTATPLPGEPLTTVITGFGPPSIADNGAIAVLATLSTANGKQTAILTGTSPTIAFRTTDPAPNPGGPALAFSSFGDPVCDQSGNVAFTATLSDGHSTQTGLWSNITGSWQRVAVEGGDADGVVGATYGPIISFVMSTTGEVFYVASIKGGPPGTGLGIWAYDGTGNHLLLRQGDTLNGGLVTSFATLTALAGSPGQGRSYFENTLVARLSQPGGINALAQLTPGTPPNVMVTTPLFLHGPEIFYIVNTVGIPSVSASNTMAFLGTLTTGKQVIIANSPSSNFEVIARQGSSAPGIGSGSFSSFSDPVYNSESVTAFIASLKGTGISSKNGSGIWWTGTNGLTLAARAGDAAAEVSGAVWNAFTSLALPDGGLPVFVAKLSTGIGPAGAPAGVDATNNIGVWSIDNSETVRLLVRTGDILHVDGQSKPLMLMNILSAVPGSPGQGRNYNANRDLIYRATFSDRSQAIMRIHLP